MWRCYSCNNSIVSLSKNELVSVETEQKSKSQRSLLVSLLSRLEKVRGPAVLIRRKWHQIDASNTSQAPRDHSRGALPLLRSSPGPLDRRTLEPSLIRPALFDPQILRFHVTSSRELEQLRPPSNSSWLFRGEARSKLIVERPGAAKCGPSDLMRDIYCRQEVWGLPRLLMLLVSPRSRHKV